MADNTFSASYVPWISPTYLPTDQPTILDGATKTPAPLRDHLIYPDSGEGKEGGRERGVHYLTWEVSRCNTVSTCILYRTGTLLNLVFFSVKKIENPGHYSLLFSTRCLPYVAFPFLSFPLLTSMDQIRLD